jgi:hypothetical protein
MGYVRHFFYFTTPFHKGLINHEKQANGIVVEQLQRPGSPNDNGTKKKWEQNDDH